VACGAFSTHDFVPKRKSQSRCQTGDIWQLGSHKLICGDALDPEVITQLMADEAARMVFTDPPYNVPIKGNVSGLGKVRHDDFAMACGEMSKDGFTSFLNTSFKNMAAHSMDGSIHFICMDWRHTSELQAAAEDVFTELKNLIVWVKDNGGMGGFYRSRHELIFCYKLGTAPM
jgi:DNA modification methylase